jgi:hypothetical protein
VLPRLGDTCPPGARKAVECALQGATLHVTDGHVEDYCAVFAELTRLFFDGKRELPLANFLHVLLLMRDSGRGADALERFVTSSQGVGPLPANEPVWALDLPEDVSLGGQRNGGQAGAEGPPERERVEPASFALPSRPPPESASLLWGAGDDRVGGKRKRGVWPPPAGVGWWQGEREGEDADAKRLRVLALEKEANLEEALGDLMGGLPGATSNGGKLGGESGNIGTDLNPQGGLAGQESESEKHLVHSAELLSGGLAGREPQLSEPPLTSAALVERHNRRAARKGGAGEGGEVGREENLTVGRVGEELVYRHLVEKYGSGAVHWVNQGGESGACYDLVVQGGEGRLEYLEVKATKTKDKVGLAMPWHCPVFVTTFSVLLMGFGLAYAVRQLDFVLDLFVSDFFKVSRNHGN